MDGWMGNKASLTHSRNMIEMNARSEKEEQMTDERGLFQPIRKKQTQNAKNIYMLQK